MIAGALIYNLIGTISLALMASKKKGRIACSSATYYKILFISKQIQILILYLCKTQILHITWYKGNAVDTFFGQTVYIRDEAFQ